ncbi:uncharacterized protein LDX57_002624 [Aspergillus melleus]|uniref:uncharacterized protein n=1 Tax=Aspergillus melleus TaxID=138277 RepID=UPI001E8CA7E5|nr:uncharacterized protein LDX57_002624 [Aspergillus melleus]KAH8424880.1 hypothetical protein LDX57_002624 [Aspergillus melleus]
MEKIWDRSYSKQVPQLVDFIGPVLTEYGFLIAANNWEKEVQPNPEKRKLLQGEKDKFTVSPPEGFEKSRKATFVRALFDGETKLVEGEESFSQWFKPLIEKAILMAKPLATQAATSALQKILDIVTKGSAESLPFQGTPRKDQPTIWLENAIRRALMADCALQVIETMDEKKLKHLTLSPTDAGHEEGIIDSIKTRVQKIGPFALRFAKSTVVKYLPVLLKQLEKKLKPTTESDVNLAYGNSADPRSLMPDAVLASLNPMTIPVSAANGTVARIYEDDSNPDAPPEEPRPPASPKE